MAKAALNLSAALDDSGYAGDNMPRAVLHMIGANVRVAKHSELHKFAAIFLSVRRWKGALPGSTISAGFGKTTRESLSLRCR